MTPARDKHTQGQAHGRQGAPVAGHQATHVPGEVTGCWEPGRTCAVRSEALRVGRVWGSWELR